MAMLALFEVDQMAKVQFSIDPVLFARGVEGVVGRRTVPLRRRSGRVLIENTPYGMVIMYYDVYKAGFAYYSNQNGILRYTCSVVMKCAVARKT
jgi:hypothetical protein